MGSIQRSLQSCSDRAGREVKYCLWFPSALGAGAVFWVVVALDKTHPLGADAASSLALLGCVVLGTPRSQPAHAKACHPAGQAALSHHCPVPRNQAHHPARALAQLPTPRHPHPEPVIHSAAVQRFSPQPQPQPAGGCWWQERLSCLSAHLSFVITLALLEAD